MYNIFMRRILLTIEYDGTNYSGWQKQPNVKTVQEEIEKAIMQSLNQKVEVYGSGRTDAGVHALNQKAHFDLALPVPISKLSEILNNVLPDDIVIKKAEEVTRVGVVKKPLDIDKMRECASLLVGEHDFQGFCSANTATDNFVRTIYDITIAREGEFIKVDVSGSGFLYNMVRIIVGTLVDFSLGRLSLEDIKCALASGDRSKSGQTMSPHGLYLKDVEY